MDSNKIYSNFLWRFLERCGAQAVTFIVSLVLARLLSPEIYGTVALITVFTTILEAFVDSGLGNALIQKKDTDDIDFSSVFFFNICISIVLYLLMFLLAPLIAAFYNMPDLTALVRVLSLVIVIAGVKNIQQAYVSRNLLYKKFFYSTLTGTVFAAIVGITMAYKGFGAWALVIQMLVNTFVDTLMLWFIVRWRPRFVFSLSRLKTLFSYGWKLLVSALLDIIYNELTQLVIGKKYSSSDLGYYNQGKKFPSVFVSNINVAIDSVLLPVMSKDQDSTNRIKAMTRRSIRVGIYIMAPIMVCLGVSGKALITVLLTEKWLPALPYLWIFCIIYMLYPLQTANLNAIKALGRSDIYLRLEVIKKIIGIAILFATMSYGVMAMALGVMVTRILYQFINAIPSYRLFGYSVSELLRDLSPALFISALMGIMVYLLSYLNIPSIIVLILQLLLSVVIYIVLSILFKIDSYYYVKDAIISLLSKRNKMMGGNG